MWMRYPPELPQQMVELLRAGRSAKALAQEFEPSERTIRNWLKQADVDNGRRTGGLTSDEQVELRRLRREVRQLKLEREIQEEPRPGLLGRPGRCPSRIRIRESNSGHVCGAVALPHLGVSPRLVLRVAPPWAVGAGAGPRTVAGANPGDSPGLPRRLWVAEHPRRARGDGSGMPTITR